MEPIFTAIPDKSYVTILLLFFITICSIIITLLAQKGKFSMFQGAYKQMSVLLGGILSLLFLATTVLYIWNAYRIQPIHLYENHLECYHGKILYKEIKKAGIYTDLQKSFVNPQLINNKSRMLVVESTSKPVAIFLEDYYDIDELVRKIKKRMEE